MFGSLDISTSGLIAQRQRLDVITANMVNMNTTHDAQGNYAPFRRRIAVFAPGDPSSGSEQGVHLREIQLDQSPFRKVYDPGNPDADPDGYIEMPNIDSAVEMVNALDASRAYEANITAVEATKSMMQSALRLLA
ncbi:MAG: flagellar basal body rod protein FlgC [Phycisphaera sp.]|nr:flagellar basal body rod protein FlgC [Phycisphaera sp.]